MAGLDFKAPVTREQEDEAIIARNMRTGVILFVVYVLMYGGFIGLAAFSPKAMAAPVLRHRMALSFGARARGETIDGIIARVRDNQLRKAA